MESYRPPTEEEKKLAAFKQRLRVLELKFIDSFASLGFKHVAIPGDGNCLFRAVCMSLYGSDDSHLELRRVVAQYLRLNSEFFRPFITGIVERYIQTLEENGSWAGDIELQILSEIYDCPVEIYTTSNKAIKVFNEAADEHTEPIRLLYLQRNHYDAIVPDDKQAPLHDVAFGGIEKEALSELKRNKKDPARLKSSRLVFEQDCKLLFMKFRRRYSVLLKSRQSLWTTISRGVPRVCCENTNGTKRRRRS